MAGMNIVSNWANYPGLGAQPENTEASNRNWASLYAQNPYYTTFNNQMANRNAAQTSANNQFYNMNYPGGTLTQYPGGGYGGGNSGFDTNILTFLNSMKNANADTAMRRQLAMQQPNLDLAYAQLREPIAFQKWALPQEQALSYAQLREPLAQQASQFAQTFPESQRQFDVTSQQNDLKNWIDYQLGIGNLGLGYYNANTNSYNNMMNWLSNLLGGA